MSLVQNAPARSMIQRSPTGHCARKAPAMRKQLEPSRLKKKFWPDEERLLWDQLISQPNPNATAHAEHAYGRWLTFLHFHYAEALKIRATNRITQHNVHAYVEYLHALGKSAETVQDRLQGLMKAARILSPNRSWLFIYMIAARHRRSPNKKQGGLKHDKPLRQ